MTSSCLGAFLDPLGTGDILTVRDTADVEYLMETLPIHARQIMALGPIEEEDFEKGKTQESCRACQALRSIRFVSDPRIAYLAEWHNESVYDPNGGLASYLRCLLIYLLAGWEPE